MRRLTLSAVAFAFTLLVPYGLQAQNAIIPFIGGGLARGVADLADDTSNGWLVLGGFDLPMDGIYPGFSVGLTGGYAFIPYTGGFDESAQVTTVDVEASFTIGDAASMVRPFVRGGGGLHLQRNDPGNIDENPTTDMSLGFGGGAGVNIMAGSVDVMLGARFSTAPGGGGVLGFFAGIALPLR